MASVKALLTSSATTGDVVEATTRWQQLVSSDPAGADMDYAVSRRTAWLFPNGYLLVIAPSFGPTISYLDDMISWDSIAPLPEELQGAWKSENYANGWRTIQDPQVFPRTEAILEILENLTSVNGKPRLVIPWRDSWAADVVDEGDDYFTSEASSQGEAVDPVLRSVQEMFRAVLGGQLEGQSPWEVEFSSPEAYLPRFCSYMEYKKFLDEIENRQLAIVVRNVWTDYTREENAQEIRANHPQFANLPIVWALKDYSLTTFYGNGWVNDALMYVFEPELEKNLYILAEEMDLSLTPKWGADEVDDEEWEAEGLFQIGSDFD